MTPYQKHSRKMKMIEGNRYYTRKNEIIGTFAGWVVSIKPTFVGNGLLLRWTVTFSAGSGGPTAEPIYCEDLENAFSLVKQYQEQTTFDKLMNALNNDHNQPSDSSYSNNGL